MAFLYLKNDQKSGQGRWFCSVKIAGKDERFSLRLTSTPGNKRAAQRRCDQLQVDIDRGALHANTRSWLGSSAARVESLLSPQGAVAGPSWGELAAEYLEVCHPNDTRGGVNGKLNARDRTKMTRRHHVKSFARYAEGHSLDEFQALASGWITEGLKDCTPDSVRRGKFPYICLFGDWLEQKGLVAPVNRKELKRLIPAGVSPFTPLPDHQSDLGMIAALRDHRRDSDVTWAAWCVVVMVRGLGCRPSESYSLTWDTVDLAPGRETVRFLDTKECRSKKVPHRTAPVLFEWVRESLVEMRDEAGVAKLVCNNTRGEPWLCDSLAPRVIASACSKCGVDYHKPKAMQKLAITQMINSGFPPHVVAFWTGHTLSMQERHYIEEDGYLPSVNDYLGFGTLSEFGEKAYKKFIKTR